MTATLRTVCRHLRRLAGEPADKPTDAELLRRFAEGRDEDAFAALVRRHGPLVPRACRRLLPDSHDADDAFQATFFVLARKASAIRRGEALAGWLHAVAGRSARELRRRAARRRAHEGQVKPMPRPSLEAEADWRELQEILHEEVERLPERYRAPFALCCLEGLSKAEAARALGCKEGTLSGRARARERLRGRLARRGVALSAALTALAVNEEAALATVPPALLDATVRAGVAPAGRTVAAGAAVAAVVRGVSRGLLRDSVRPLLALVAGVLVLAAGAGAVALHGTPASTATPSARQEPKGQGQVAQDAGRPGIDPLGDPLPDGAVMRLGSTRLRHGNAVKGLAFAPDGKALAAVDLDGTLLFWDPTTGKAVRQIPRATRGQVISLAFSPDGKAVAVGRHDYAITLSDSATGREFARLEGHLGPVPALAFSRDGKWLVSAARDKTVRLWDPWARRELRTLDLGGEAPLALAVTPGDKLVAVAFAPDERKGAPGGKSGVRLWDPSTGKQIRVLNGGADPVSALAFAPDGKILAGGGKGKAVVLWDPSTGKEVRRLEGLRHEARGLACAPDGKRLAVAGATLTVGPGGELRVWDPTTGKEDRRFRDPGLPLEAVAFSPDGRLLVSGNYDTTALVWDLRVAGRTAPPAADLATLWDDLKDTDAARAYQAILRLSGTPARSVPFLRERLRLPAPPEAGRLACLVADLESAQFAVRQKAVVELEQVLVGAEPALRQALGKGLAAESQLRLRRLLAKLEGPEQLRLGRALEALERADTPAAHAALRALAEGAAGAWRTEEANRIVRRLGAGTP